MVQELGKKLLQNYFTQVKKDDLAKTQKILSRHRRRAEQSHENLALFMPDRPSESPLMTSSSQYLT